MIPQEFGIWTFTVGALLLFAVRYDDADPDLGSRPFNCLQTYSCITGGMGAGGRWQNESQLYHARPRTFPLGTFKYQCHSVATPGFECVTRYLAGHNGADSTYHYNYAAIVAPVIVKGSRFSPSPVSRRVVFPSFSAVDHFISSSPQAAALPITACVSFSPLILKTPGPRKLIFCPPAHSAKYLLISLSTTANSLLATLRLSPISARHFFSSGMSSLPVSSFWLP